MANTQDNPRQMPSAGQRLRFVTYMQIIDIILVVLGHSVEMYSGGNRPLLIHMVYTFHMPVFTFISGFLLMYSSLNVNKPHRGNFFAGKVRRLLVPYLFLTLVTFVPRALLSRYAYDPIELSWEGLTKSLIYSNFLIPYFWFLTTIFILLCVCYSWMWLTRRMRISDAYSLIALVFVALIIKVEGIDTQALSLHKVAAMGLFFVLGLCYCKWMPQVDRAIAWDRPIVFLGFVAAWLGSFFLLSRTDAYWLVSLPGIAMCIALTRWMVCKDIKVLDHLSGANYIIFLLSWYVNVAAQQLLSHFIVLPWWAHTALSLFGGIYLPWLIFKWMERNARHKPVRMLGFLLGQNLAAPK